MEQIKVLMLPFLMNGSCIGKRSKYNADKKIQFLLHYCRILFIVFSFSIVVPKKSQIDSNLVHSAYSQLISRYQFQDAYRLIYLTGIF